MTDRPAEPGPGDPRATPRRWSAAEDAELIGKRLFVAVPLEEGARAAVAALMARLGAEAGRPTSGWGGRGPADPTPTGLPRLRWVASDKLHLTLRFLGPTPDESLPAVAAAVAEAAQGVAPFRAALEGAGAYPHPVRPRVLWIGVGEGRVALGDLAARLDRALAARGWPLPDRPFSAHLTLARSDGIAGAGRVVGPLEEAASSLDASWTVDRLVLFESITGGGPARYLPLATGLLVPAS